VIPYLDVGAAYLELEGALSAAFHRVMRSGRYVLGPEVEAFEREFAQYCGARYCVGVGNGLDALRLILEAYGIGPRDEVIVPSNTYIATWLAVSATGARPIPVEPDEATYNLDPLRVEAAITPRTRAILAVHLYGRPADMAGLAIIASRHKLRLVSDCAHAHGAERAGMREELLGEAGGFSFYPGKNLGAFGDGGAVVTDDRYLDGRIRELRNYGEVRKYVNSSRGWNSRLDELQAALLRVRLRRLSDWNTRRARIASRYCGELAGVLDLRGAMMPIGDRHAYHVFAARSKARNELRDRLQAAGVQTLIHYPIPPHLQDCYLELGHAQGEFPIAERMAAEELSLPIGPHMTEADVSAVIAAIKG
jgi:dTDP-4-amino-4,6-dideoxygalactose transaminase